VADGAVDGGEAFPAVSRMPPFPRYAHKPLLLSTNKTFSDWRQVFPHAACVVTLVDRLVHRAEVIEIEAESYRLKEAKELNAARSKQRRARKH
jgi:hypothetical protein